MITCKATYLSQKCEIVAPLPNCGPFYVLEYIADPGSAQIRALVLDRDCAGADTNLLQIARVN